MFLQLYTHIYIAIYICFIWIFFSHSLTSHYKIHAFFPSLDCHDAQYKNNLGIQTFIRTLLYEIGVTCHSQQCQQTSACSSDIRSSAVLVALSLCVCAPGRAVERGGRGIQPLVLVSNFTLTNCVPITEQLEKTNQTAICCKTLLPK